MPLVDEGNVEVELAGVFRLELTRLEFDDDVPELFGVEEEQVEVMPMSE